ncbi:hypothetical protein MRX96_014284 [Rhipicephalus microplus]
MRRGNALRCGPPKERGYQGTPYTGEPLEGPWWTGSNCGPLNRQRSPEELRWPGRVMAPLTQEGRPTSPCSRGAFEAVSPRLHRMHMHVVRARHIDPHVQ